MSMLLLVFILLLNFHVALCSCYKRIFSFGDSIIDTGNFVHLVGNSSSSKYKEPPYGMTFFKQATGQMCDGRVLIDFYAQALHLSMIPPNMPEQDSGQFSHGANFAVLGSTALPASLYRGFNHTVWPWPLGRQTGARRRVLGESLILFGELGGGDYISWFNAGRSREEAKLFIPMVVSTISNFLEEIIYWGAKAAMIPNNFPLGCLPSFLSRFHSKEPKDYDENGCLKWFNDFSRTHNDVLLMEVNRLREFYPAVKFIYADYYGATMDLIKNARRYGFGNTLVACCGGDGPYHTSVECNEKAKVWGNPDGFVSWDGMHMTEKAYNFIAQGVLNGPFADPPLLRNCSN
ncbi:hypothetical protein PR202_ga09832 [Eleusine coracana subsp. coracana]|uniref:GDSL esterase/lipase n=1 Tax=Eleusine coracana subsp. coracana TaxID=191504 RepID=A0AAV5C4S9_ELECO|nr:hypothetical protein PR202_ga09832 [Eleusine coracana subsp. coracana]